MADGARSDGEILREGEVKGVLEDRKLTLSMKVMSEKVGELGNDSIKLRNRRPKSKKTTRFARLTASRHAILNDELKGDEAELMVASARARTAGDNGERDDRRSGGRWRSLSWGHHSTGSC